MATKSSALVLTLPLLLNIGLAHGASINLSTEGTAMLDGVSFTDRDIVNYDPGDTTKLFDGTGKFAGSEDLDAVHVDTSGNILFSTRSDAQFTGANILDFKDGDIVEYDPDTNMASIFFSESNFQGDADITAFHVLPSGNYVLSTKGEETLGELLFSDGDLIEYNPSTDLASLFFSEDLFSSDADVDAVHVLLNGNIVFSTVEDSLTLGGLTFGNGDLVEYDPVAMSASLFFAETLFVGGDENIDAAHIAEVSEVPLPASIWLFGTGLLAMVSAAKRHA